MEARELRIEPISQGQPIARITLGFLLAALIVLLVDLAASRTGSKPTLGPAVLMLIAVSTLCWSWSSRRRWRHHHEQLFLQLDEPAMFMRQERYAEAEARLVDLFERSRGFPDLQALALHDIGAARISQGGFAQALAAFAEVRRSGQFDRGVWRTLRPLVFANTAITRAMLGDVLGASADLDEAAREPSGVHEASVEYVRFYVTLRRGETTAALARVAEHWTELERGLSVQQMRWVAALRAFAAFRAAATQDDVAAWIAKAQPASQRVLRNLSHGWPELREFLERRGLIDASAPSTAAS